MVTQKNDIKNKKQIRASIERFYELIKKDRVLKIYFKSFDEQMWNDHLIAMTAFWSNILLFSDDYQGNPMLMHYKINQIKNLKSSTFKRWLMLFEQAITDKHSGENVQMILEKSKSIAQILESQITQNQ